MSKEVKNQITPLTRVNAIATIGCGIGWILIWKGFLESADEFQFQRLGSVVIIVALLTEVAIVRHIRRMEIGIIKCLIDESFSQNEIEHFELSYLTPSHYLAEGAALFLGILGTVIWGYGDLLYINLKQLFA